MGSTIETVRSFSIATALLLLATLGTATPAKAQAPAKPKSGGILRVYNTTQPPSASIHEESTIATNMPFMAVFNNLVRFDPEKPRNSLAASRCLNRHRLRKHRCRPDPQALFTVQRPV